MSLAHYCLTQIGIKRFVPLAATTSAAFPEIKAEVNTLQSDLPTPLVTSAPSDVAPATVATASLDIAPDTPPQEKMPREAKPINMAPIVAIKTPSTQGELARQAAIDACTTLSSLHTLVQNCKHCSLCQHRGQAVPGAGADKPTWLIVGEAPGEEEDKQGVPFVGQSGKLLTQIYATLGISRDIHAGNGSAYIANAIKCRPAANRTPDLHEVAACRPFLVKQIALLQPKIIVAVGRIAAMALLGDDKTPLGKMRERVFRWQENGQDIPLIVTYHPAYLLRNLPEKRKSWEDALFALTTLRENL